MKRHTLPTVVAALISFAGLVPLHAAESSPPDIVVFIADDHGYQDNSVTGSKQFPTPALERLAHDGMTLNH